MKRPFKVYIIRHKQTGKPWVAPKGIWNWRVIGHAKNSFIQNNWRQYKAGCFDEEDFPYEVFCIGEYSWDTAKSESK